MGIEGERTFQIKVRLHSWTRLPASLRQPTFYRLLLLHSSKQRFVIWITVCYLLLTQLCYRLLLVGRRLTVTDWHRVGLSPLKAYSHRIHLAWAHVWVFGKLPSEYSFLIFCQNHNWEYLCYSSKFQLHTIYATAMSGVGYTIEA